MFCLKSPPFLPQSLTGLQRKVPLNDLIISDMIFSTKCLKMITYVQFTIFSSCELRNPGGAGKARFNVATPTYDQYHEVPNDDSRMISELPSFAVF